mgnify:CR=1 FL=1
MYIILGRMQAVLVLWTLLCDFLWWFNLLAHVVYILSIFYRQQQLSFDQVIDSLVRLMVGHCDMHVWPNYQYVHPARPGRKAHFLSWFFFIEVGAHHIYDDTGFFHNYRHRSVICMTKKNRSAQNVTDVSFFCSANSGEQTKRLW